MRDLIIKTCWKVISIALYSSASSRDLLDSKLKSESVLRGSSIFISNSSKSNKIDPDIIKEIKSHNITSRLRA